MIREPQRLLRGACERRVASAVMQARRIHVAASWCGRDRIAMRAPPVRRREPCCVCARVAAAAKEVVRLEWKTACYHGPCFTYFFIAHSSATCGLFEFYVFFIAHSSSATCCLFVCVFRFFFIARSPAGMRAVFSHRPVPPIRVVASKKEKKAGSACTLDMIAELNRGVRGGLLVLGQHVFTGP